MLKTIFSLLVSLSFLCLIKSQPVLSATALDATLLADEAGPRINRDIFGQFSEHIGEGIYGGIWVGKDSKIPNVNGIRSDVVAALRDINVPVVRWPGGCFADQYHWREGVGPQASRQSRINQWGNVLEPNSFGTDEFMEFIKQIGSEAYITANVGSGSVQEAADWLEYMTSDLPTTLTQKRAANGHAQPYQIKYIGFGNEAWGCGGAMTADEYFARMKPFSVLALNHNPEQRFSGIDMLFNHAATNPNSMQRIAAGANDTDTAFTEAMMKNWAEAPGYLPIFDSLSLHHYTMTRGPMSDPSTDFGEAEYVKLLQLALGMDDILKMHSKIMDKYDPKKLVSLVVDEWGNWLKPDLAKNKMFLKQQNSLRDAITTSLTLNVFSRHGERVRMTNIAQMVNVIQAMILTDGEKMLLTPTYHIYRLYKPFQDAQLIPVDVNSGQYSFADITIAQVDVLAARAKDGKVWLALTNVDPNNSVKIKPMLKGIKLKSAKGEVLTAERINSVNTFELPDLVAPKFVNIEAGKGSLILELPPSSVTVVALLE